MSQKFFFDIFSSSLLFVLVNSAGVYLIVADDVFVDFEYPVILIICYIYLYINSAIAFFGYRVRRIDGFLKLSTLLGKEVELNLDDISSLRSILSYIYILKSKSGIYLIWSTMNKAEREKLENFAMQR
ncbi:MAG: hypothetical protein KZQ95_20080 [Candidatus Thiodiazotropha sp. (ex Epidulcina cf. delphinae)]|nr:hypothetical protein [Candidatus Thiodiazotropha sp. (ex Epidulcina cf. delphinae)]